MAVTVFGAVYKCTYLLTYVSLTLLMKHIDQLKLQHSLTTRLI